MYVYVFSTRLDVNTKWNAIYAIWYSTIYHNCLKIQTLRSQCVHCRNPWDITERARHEPTAPGGKSHEGFHGQISHGTWSSSEKNMTTMTLLLTGQ